MTERAEVVALHGESVTVRCETSDTCASCSALLCNPRARTYRAVVGADVRAGAAPRDVGGLSSGASSTTGVALRVGDRVEVEVPERGALGKGLLLFGLPLASFVVVYLALGAAADETLRVGLSFAGLGAGMALAVAASRFVKEARPVIVRVFRDPVLAPLEMPGQMRATGNRRPNS